MHKFSRILSKIQISAIHVTIVSLLLLLAIMFTGCWGEQPTPTQEAIRATQTPKATFTPVPTNTPIPTATSTPKPTPTPTRSEKISPLTGTEVEDIDHLRRRVLAVRVGNDPGIRPQEGLGLADIVYEELMEGGDLTRLTAIYLNNDAERIRPIRSARLVSLDIVSQYDGALVHTGAHDRVRYMISQASFVDLDEFFHRQPYGYLYGYDWRGRVYTSVQAVHEYLEKKGWEREEPIDGYQFDPQVPTGKDASTVHIPYPWQCVVDWTYAPEKGYYLRQVQGRPLMDRSTDEQIHAENVILFYAEHKRTSILDHAHGAPLLDIDMSGSGPAQICRDGVVIEGEWIAEEPGELIEYYDSEGNIIPLKPGKTWIQLVPLDYEADIE